MTKSNSICNLYLCMNDKKVKSPSDLGCPIFASTAKHIVGRSNSSGHGVWKLDFVFDVFLANLNLLIA